MSFALSIEKEYPGFADSCHALLVGKSAYSGFPGVPFDLHRYKDGWHVYWKNPPNGQIGRHLRTRDELNFFLKGNWSVGAIVMLPLKRGVVAQRPSKRRN